MADYNAIADGDFNSDDTWDGVGHPDGADDTATIGIGFDITAAAAVVCGQITTAGSGSLVAEAAANTITALTTAGTGAVTLGATTFAGAINNASSGLLKCTGAWTGVTTFATGNCTATGAITCTTITTAASRTFQTGAGALTCTSWVGTSSAILTIGAGGATFAGVLTGVSGAITINGVCTNITAFTTGIGACAINENVTCSGIATFTGNTTIAAGKVFNCATSFTVPSAKTLTLVGAAAGGGAQLVGMTADSAMGTSGSITMGAGCTISTNANSGVGITGGGSSVLTVNGAADNYSTFTNANAGASASFFLKAFGTYNLNYCDILKADPTYGGIGTGNKLGGVLKTASVNIEGLGGSANSVGILFSTAGSFSAVLRDTYISNCAGTTGYGISATITAHGSNCILENVVFGKDREGNVQANTTDINAAGVCYFEGKRVYLSAATPLAGTLLLAYFDDFQASVATLGIGYVYDGNCGTIERSTAAAKAGTYGARFTPLATGSASAGMPLKTELRVPILTGESVAVDGYARTNAGSTIPTDAVTVIIDPEKSWFSTTGSVTPTLNGTTWQRTQPTASTAGGTAQAGTCRIVWRVTAAGTAGDVIDVADVTVTITHGDASTTVYTFSMQNWETGSPTADVPAAAGYTYGDEEPDKVLTTATGAGHYVVPVQASVLCVADGGTAYGPGSTIAGLATLPLAADVQSGAADYGVSGALRDPAYQTTAATQSADAAILELQKDHLSNTETVTFGASSVVGTLNLTLYTLISGVAIAGDVRKGVARYSGGPNGSLVGCVDSAGVNQGATGVLAAGSVYSALALWVEKTDVVSAEDVRDGTLRYTGGGNGSLAVPNPSDVRFSVETDATTGTLIGVVDNAGVWHAYGTCDSSKVWAVAGIIHTSGTAAAWGTLSSVAAYNATGVIYGSGTYATEASRNTDPGEAYVLVGHDYTILGAGKTASYSPDFPDVGNTRPPDTTNGVLGTLANLVATDAAYVTLEESRNNDNGTVAGDITTGNSVKIRNTTITGSLDISLYTLISNVVAASWVVVGHDNYTGGSAGGYPTTATSQAAQLATDQAAVLAAAENIDGGVVILEQEGTGVNATTLANTVDARLAAWGKTGFSLVATGLDLVLIDGKTLPVALQHIAAGAAGIISGAGTGTELLKGLNKTTTRMTATVDADGNRTAITYNDV